MEIIDISGGGLLSSARRPRVADVRPVTKREADLLAMTRSFYWDRSVSITDHSLAGRQRVVNFLGRVLRGETARGRAGHWTYSTGLHAAIFRVWRVEHRELEALWLKDAA